MLRRARSLLAGAAISLLTMLSGCFEIDTVLVIKADGSARASQTMRVSEGMVKAMRDMADLDPSAKDSIKEMEQQLLAFDKSAKKKLKKKGVKVLKHDVVLNDTTVMSEWDVSLNSVVNLNELAVLTGSESFAASVTDNKDGTSTVKWEGSKPEAKQKEDADKPTLTPEQEEKMQAIAMGMFSEASKMRMDTKITAPGAIVSYTPKTGATVDGNTVTWHIDAKSMMAMAGETLGGADGGFAVTYSTP